MYHQVISNPVKAKMLSSSHEVPQKSLQIKEEGTKVFSRIVSKESSIANPSFRVYYGGVSGSVPFMWESQPGTPKHKFSDNSLPPLTPPPSYYSKDSNKPAKKHSRSKLFHTLFLRISLKKSHVPSSPSSSSSLWSSSMSVPMTPSKKKIRGRSRFLSFDNNGVVEDEELGVYGSPTSTLCFGIHGRESNGGARGGHSVVVMKKALLSVVGRRSA